MKHIFIVNPVSGKNNTIDFVGDLIVPACEKAGVDYEIYTTKEAGDGIRYVDEYAGGTNETCRFYAVGGDGTLYEVVNGAFGHANAQVAVIPKGSGNDWIRLFGDLDLFRDVEGQLEGTPIAMDCIKIGDEIAINQCSLGFDAETCSGQARMKKVPGAIGHTTYQLAAVYCMFMKTWFDFDVHVDSRKMKGPFIQVVAANSRWYGSGIKVAPYAMPDDHELDFVIFRRVASWPFMIKPMLYNWQIKGDHPKFSWVEYYRGSRMTVECPKPAQINVDGECHEVTDVTIELVKDGLTFVVPRDSTFFEDVRTGKLNNKIEKHWRNKEPIAHLLSNFKPFNILINNGFLKLNKHRNY